MKLAKFERKEAKRCGVSVETLRKFYEITPCDCGISGCKGWQTRYKYGAERQREIAVTPWILTALCFTVPLRVLSEPRNSGAKHTKGRVL